MSDWQLNQDKGVPAQIAMPPLPAEEQAPAPVEQVAVQQVEYAPEVEQEVGQPVEQEAQRAQYEYEKENDRNIRAVREEARRLRTENDRLMREAQQRNQKPQENYDDIDDDVRADDIVEGKHLKKMTQKLRQLENKLEQSSIEIRLKTQFPDFDRVVTDSTINMLKDEHPELYQTLYSSTDLYNKAASAYTLIKKLGIGQISESERDREVAKKNSVKPRPVTSIAPQQGNTPLSQANAFANGLTPELQAQLIKEMAQARKGY